MAWWQVFQNLQGIAIRTNDDKTVAHIAKYKTVIHRKVAWWQIFQNMQEMR